jgi:NAD(P)-dependent dehydrogenase (short-subunit alcohol dehydrogenase family)
LTESGSSCRRYPGDVRDARSVAAVTARVQEELGVPDIVVANAGIYPTTPFLELTEDEWDRVMETNIKGVFFLRQHAARAMVAAQQAGHLSFSIPSRRVGQCGAGHITVHPRRPF